MPGTSAQLLVTFDVLTGSGVAINPPPQFASARLRVLALAPSVSFQAPLGASAAVSLFALAFSGQAGFTNHGLVRGQASFNLSCISTALGGALNPSSAGLVASVGQGGNQIVVQGPKARAFIPLSALGAPPTVPATSSWTSPPVDSFGYMHVTWGLTSSQAGSAFLNRFVDNQGVVSIGAAVTQAVTAATATALESNDGKGFGSFAIGFSNTSASVATLSSMALMLSAA